MAIEPFTKIHHVYEVDENLPTMRAFLLGAVRSWTKNRPNETFALRDLVGGDNWEWRNTPLYPLFQKHERKDKTNEQAMSDAAKDAGWLLKSVLNDDDRQYRVVDAGLTNGYQLISSNQQ